MAELMQKARVSASLSAIFSVSHLADGGLAPFPADW